MQTLLKCSQSRYESRWASTCSNPAEWVDIDHVDLNHLYCKSHKAGNSRRRYNQAILGPIADYVDILAPLLTERQEFERRRSAESTDKYHLQMLAVMKHNWVEEGQQAYTLRADGESWNNRIKEWNIHKVVPDKSQDRTREHQISVDDDESQFDDVILPVVIRWSGTGVFGSNSARKLADSLYEAADFADSINDTRRPK